MTDQMTEAPMAAESPAPTGGDLAAVDTLEGEGLTIAARSFGRQTWDRFRSHRLAMIGLGTFVLLLISFWVGPLVSGADPAAVDVLQRNLGPSLSHPFGTDEIGRDLFVRTMNGAKISVRIAVTVALISTAIGTVLGALAGYFGKYVDFIISQVINMLLIIPGIIILLVVAVKWGGSINQTAFILAVLLWIGIARIVRGLVMQLKEQEFILAARAAGAGSGRIITRHLLPNVAGPVFVQVTLIAGTAIILESTLSFLGLGVLPPETSLGVLINQAKGAIDVRPSRVLIPGGIVTLFVLSLNFVGDGLRDALDPTNRGGRS